MSKTAKKCPRQGMVTALGPFFRYLEQHRGIDEVHFAGSIRRELPYVGDVDITASLNGRVGIDNMWDSFVRDQGITYIKGGDFERTIFLGHNVEIRFFRPQEMGSALLFTTGSHDFNIALRALAKKKNMLLNRYGLWTRDKKTLIASATEFHIFKELDLSFIDPKDRDNTGAIWEVYRRA